MSQWRHTQSLQCVSQASRSRHSRCHLQQLVPLRSQCQLSARAGALAHHQRCLDLGGSGVEALALRRPFRVPGIVEAITIVCCGSSRNEACGPHQHSIGSPRPLVHLAACARVPPQLSLSLPYLKASLPAHADQCPSHHHLTGQQHAPGETKAFPPARRTPDSCHRQWWPRCHARPNQQRLHPSLLQAGAGGRGADQKWQGRWQASDCDKDPELVLSNRVMPVRLSGSAELPEATRYGAHSHRRS